jgi:hypothetical protein
MINDVCDHLRCVREYIDSFGAKVTYRGKSWDHARYWIYYEAVMDAHSLIIGFNLGDNVIVENMEDYKLGMEYGIYCRECHDAIIGIHPKDNRGKNSVKIKFV